MNVVIEGIDGAGKTRLAKFISSQLSIDYVDRDSLGCGPPTSHKDIIDRLERYLQVDGGVFDRHTAISQPIYGTLRDDEPLPEALIHAFYAQKPVIIYARCIDDGLEAHKPDADEDPGHLKSLAANYEKLLAMYDKWAANHAHIFYRQYADMKLVTQMVQGAFRR